jgi:hypothetical protein
MYMDVIIGLFIQQQFHIVTIVNSAPINMAVQISSFGYIPSSGITRSCGTSISNFLKNCHAFLEL